jgi:hypothetical protein
MSKREKLLEIELEWENFTDYILHTVFSRVCSKDIKHASKQRHAATSSSVMNKKKVENRDLYEANTNETLECVFARNEFPYDLLDGQHWILWFNCAIKPYPNERISEEIISKLESLLGPEVDFDFGWYCT